MPKLPKFFRRKWQVTEPVLTEEFAEKVHEVLKDFPDSIKLTSLICICDMPEPFLSKWKSFMGSISNTQKGNFSRALTPKLRKQMKTIGDIRKSTYKAISSIRGIGSVHGSFVWKAFRRH